MENRKQVHSKRFVIVLFCVLFVGCAGMGRSCSSCNAESFGANWVVAQMDLSGKPFRCWELHGVSITNESGSDGIYWKSESGHLVHLSGTYNRVQVNGDDWDGAFKELGLTRQSCGAVRAQMFDPTSSEYRTPEKPPSSH